ncbi:helix-turn-helix domain-containing protein [Neobacillus cucumis]|nr:helix-turn-helix domain-containing protein [Neobacillus cucumis]
MTLSDKLRELLDKQNGSQETLADMMKKMHRSAISRYECENLRK